MGESRRRTRQPTPVWRSPARLLDMSLANLASIRKSIRARRPVTKVPTVPGHRLVRWVRPLPPAPDDEAAVLGTFLGRPLEASVSAP